MVVNTRAVGLTGGLATGKSLVCGMLKELGATIIDADVIAHQLTEPGSPVLNNIFDAFGEAVFSSPGILDRRCLRNIIIESGDARNRLNHILHPGIIEREEQLLELSNTPITVIDAALLIESGHYKRFEDIVLVYAPAKMQVVRLMERDGMSEDEAIRFIATQMDIEEKRKFATHVIDNSGTIAETKSQVSRLYALLSK